MPPKRVAVVTGSNKGLGFAIVKLLCENYEGQVYLTSRDENKGRQACEDLKKLGLDPLYHQLDITDYKSVRKFVKCISDEKQEVDVLINNAGIRFSEDAPESKIVQAEETVSVNFRGMVDFTEAILPLVQCGGSIVNITSSSSHLSRLPSEKFRRLFCSTKLTLDELKNMVSTYIEDVKQNQEIDKGWGNSPYIVSKIAVNSYTFMLHRRLKMEGITVNCVHPGYVISDMTRGVGLVTPDKAAKLPVKLALQPVESGLFVWENGRSAFWDGPDPRFCDWNTT